jgi:hypothetical protein
MKKALTFFSFLFISFLVKAQSSFTWTTWDKVSLKIKNELKAVKIDKNTSVYNSILKYKKDGVRDSDLSVAVIDMDKDGKSEYAIAIQASEWCGSLGCALEVYKDGGKKQIHLTDEIESVKPQKNGVLSSQGKLITFEIVSIQ